MAVLTESRLRTWARVLGFIFTAMKASGVSPKVLQKFEELIREVEQALEEFLRSAAPGPVAAVKGEVKK